MLQSDTSTALQYNGNPIRYKGEELNLTDMWRANGADPYKAPSDWKRKEGAQFIEFIEENLDMPKGHSVRVEKGKVSSTWAHWQVGFAYAKYLSHEFHAWCNEAARESSPWKMRWEPELAMAVSALYGHAWDGKGTQPSLMAGVQARLYDILVTKEVRAKLHEVRDNTSKWDKLHQFLTPEGQRRLELDLDIVLALARTAISIGDFWDRVEANFRLAPLQLNMFRGKTLPAKKMSTKRLGQGNGATP